MTIKTVGDLIKELQCHDPALPVHVGYNYGDRAQTLVAPRVGIATTTGCQRWWTRELKPDRATVTRLSFNRRTLMYALLMEWLPTFVFAGLVGGTLLLGTGSLWEE